MSKKDELSHIGVLGMRWGHRKAEGAPGSPTNPSRRIADRVQAYKAKKAAQDKKDAEDLVKIKENTKKVLKEFDARDAKKAADKAFKKLKDDDALDREAKRRRDVAKEDVEFLVGLSKKDKNFNESDMRKRLEKEFASDLNATRESVRKERKEDSQRMIAAAFIAAVGVGASVALHVAANKTLMDAFEKGVRR